ncbi:hypothetical protein L6452_03529 [Arctium lappa]|uniref:Uncharacterized protein n=1 Tax=Arctium lappa TaxID=4217 RepID=A0ACB9FNG2_ARCLA|nr:hypothetical protein L6452_03529 [Arctium lappa]
MVELLTMLFEDLGKHRQKPKQHGTSTISFFLYCSKDCQFTTKGVFLLETVHTCFDFYGQTSNLYDTYFLMDLPIAFMIVALAEFSVAAFFG